MAAEGPRLTPTHIRDLVELTRGMINEHAPECVRGLVKIRNWSSRYKFQLRAEVDGRTFFHAETVGTLYGVAAAYPSPVLALQGREIRTEAIRAFLAPILKARFADIESEFRLNEPLRLYPGVTATEVGEGLIRLEFEALTPEAYRRIVAALVPLMAVPRYDREEPV